MRAVGPLYLGGMWQTVHRASEVLAPVSSGEG